MESLGDKIYKLREGANISQEALADKLNISRQTVSRWETDISKPTDRNIKNLCSIFGVDKSYFSMNGELAVSEERYEEADRTKSTLKIIFLVTVSVLLVLCIIACGFAGYSTIATENMRNINIRIVSRLRYVGIVCIIVGAIAFVTLIIMWVIAIKNKIKSKK